MKYKRHPDVAWRMIEDEALVVDARNGKITPLNPVAAFIWNQLDGSKELDLVQQSVIESFEVDLKQAEKDLNEFVQQLIKEELITEK